MAMQTVRCPICYNVVQVKTISILTFLFLLFIGVIPGLIYFVWRVYGTQRCPYCRSKI